MINVDVIKRWLENGFQPFTLCLSDGRRFAVPHPDNIAVGRNVVVVLDKDDASHLISTLHIVSLEEQILPP